MEPNNLICQSEEWHRWWPKQRHSKVLVVADENTLLQCMPLLRERYLNAPEVIEFQLRAGEMNKTMEQVEFLWSRWMERGVDRDALVLCLGGGLLCDLSGFAASTFKRGLRTIYFPTTNMAMCDAALGGKTGCNFMGVKNQLGSFWPPLAIVIDTDFLKTMQPRELRSGFAETIKHALIADAELWRRMGAQRVEDLWTDRDLILRSARIKMRFVEADPYDRGLRQALNFGHTVGHALEALSLATETPLLHGEAVAIGMVAETLLSEKLAGLPANATSQIVAYLKEAYPALSPGTLSAADAVPFMHQDKKNQQGRITCSLIANIGEPAIGIGVSESAMIEATEVALRHFRA